MNPFRIFGRRAEEEEEQRNLIVLIAERGDVRSLIELLPSLPPEAHRLGPEAANAAASVLERCSPLHLASFDQWYRGGWLPKGPPAPTWNDVRLGSPDWARKFKGVVALASFHGNGFVRERAVRLLADFDDGFELPYLLIRTNDWVAKVQAAAVVAVSARITLPYARHWLRSLGLVDRLRAAQRREADLARLVRRVDDLLLQPQIRPLLETALMNGELSLRRASLRLALSLSAIDDKGLLRTASSHRDPVIAVAASKAVLQHANRAEAPALVDRTIKHPLARIRLLALEAALRHETPHRIAALHRAVFDDARSVREVARHELSKLDAALDFASEYRLAVRGRHGRDRTIALEGLAEVGSRNDVDVFLRFLHDPNARARAAAIAGIGRCDGENHHDDLEAALQDHSSLVRRAVAPYAKLYLGRGAVQRLRRALRERSERAPDRPPR